MVPGIRDALRALSEPRFLSIQSRRLRRGALRRADGLLRNGWERSDGDTFPLDAPFDWERADPAELGLAAIDPLLDAHSWSGKPEYLAAAVGVAEDWLRNGRDAEGADRPAVAGHRAYRLGYLARAAAHSEAMDDSRLERMLDAAVRDGELLAGRDEPGPIPAAVGLLSLTGYLGDALPVLGDLRPQAREAALGVFGKAFTPDGVHLSRSPARHAAICAVLGSVLDSGIVDSPTLADLRTAAEDALAWLTMPDGRLVGFGSTGDVLVSPVWGSRGTVPGLLEDHYRSRTLLYAATAGALGGPDGGITQVFPNAGFAVSRSRWPASTLDEEAGYLALTAARRVDTGQQADALSFVWFDGGRLLLADAGQVVGSAPSAGPSEGTQTGPATGLEEEGPMLGVVPPSPEESRTFVRATRAHNTVEIDGTDQEPWESPPVPVIARWGEINGVRFVDAQIEFETAAHRRSLVWLPGAWLLVVDRLKGSKARRYRQWFHSADDLDVIQTHGATMISAEGKPVVWATEISGNADPMTPIRGVDGERPQGWWSPGSARLIPAWAFGWEAEGREQQLATVCSLAGRVVPLRLSGPRVGWRTGGEAIVVTLTDAGVGDIEVRWDEEVA